MLVLLTSSSLRVVLIRCRAHRDIREKERYISSLREEKKKNALLSTTTCKKSYTAHFVSEEKEAKVPQQNKHTSTEKLITFRHNTATFPGITIATTTSTTTTTTKKRATMLCASKKKKNTLKRANARIAGDVAEVAVPAVLLRSYNEPPEDEAEKGAKVARTAEVGHHYDVIDRVAEAPPAVLLHVAIVVGPGAEAEHAGTTHQAGADDVVDAVEMAHRLHSTGGGRGRHGGAARRAQHRRVEAAHHRRQNTNREKSKRGKKNSSESRKAQIVATLAKHYKGFILC